MTDAEGYPRPAAEEVPWWRAAFLEEEEVETAARAAMTVESPWLVPVLGASPRVVYGAPLSTSRMPKPLAYTTSSPEITATAAPGIW